MRRTEKGDRHRSMKTLPASDSQPLRILIVDDHAIVRDGLKQILASKLPSAIFGEGRTAQEALDRVIKEPWDILLLDISMPGKSGLDVLRQIKALQPDLEVLILTMHPEDQYALRVLKAGASGYLTKDTASIEVANAVQRVRAGGKYLSASLAQRLASHFNPSAQKAPHEILSDREYQVLRMIAAGKSVKEIGFDLSLSVKTVSTYRTRVLTKLGFKTSAELIRYAIREKLVD
jgi:DNA-binding NarL/FixJ family response regulator